MAGRGGPTTARGPGLGTEGACSPFQLGDTPLNHSSILARWKVASEKTPPPPPPPLLLLLRGNRRPGECHHLRHMQHELRDDNHNHNHNHGLGAGTNNRREGRRGGPAGGEPLEEPRTADAAESSAATPQPCGGSGGSGDTKLALCRATDYAHGAPQQRRRARRHGQHAV